MDVASTSLLLLLDPSLSLATSKRAHNLNLNSLFFCFFTSLFLHMTMIAAQFGIKIEFCLVFVGVDVVVIFDHLW